MRQLLKNPAVGNFFNGSLSHGDGHDRGPGACRRR